MAVDQTTLVDLEQRLRALAARAFSGKKFTLEAVGNLCIETADYLARQKPRYYLKWASEEGDKCPTCKADRCWHESPCHCCHAWR